MDRQIEQKFASIEFELDKHKSAQNENGMEKIHGEINQQKEMLNSRLDSLQYRIDHVLGDIDQKLERIERNRDDGNEKSSK